MGYWVGWMVLLVFRCLEWLVGGREGGSYTHISFPFLPLFSMCRDMFYPYERNSSAFKSLVLFTAGRR